METLRLAKISSPEKWVKRVVFYAVITLHLFLTNVFIADVYSWQVICIYYIYTLRQSKIYVWSIFSISMSFSLFYILYYISTIFQCNLLCILRTYLKNTFIILHTFNNNFRSFWFFQGIAFKLTWYVGIFYICISVALHNIEVILCLAFQ